MIYCQNCGQANNQSSNFCRFCGTKFAQRQFSNENKYEFAPPRPYIWKTDEFKISETKARKPQTIKQVQPLNNPFSTFQTPAAPAAGAAAPVAFSQPQYLAHNFFCPRCGNRGMPRFERKISTAGWIVFAVLLVAFFPLFWIGFLIKEDVKVCPACNLNLGS